MDKKKILFLSASFGGGHNAAVEAVQQAIEKYYPGKYEMVKIDIVSLIWPTFEKFALQFYENTSKYSKLTWKTFFEITDKTEALNVLDRGGYQLLKKQLKPIADEKPDIIISCYPFLAYSVTKYLKSIHKKTPLVSLITDTGEVHSAWISKGVDYYLAPTKETELFLIEEGIKPERIKLFGFPVKQWFYKKYNNKDTRAELKIPEKNRLIIYFSGLYGIGNINLKVIALDSGIRDVTIIVVCGNNKTLPNKLKANKYHNDVRVFGFLPNEDVSRYMSASDLVITKAGGMSVMETITSKKPMVITEVTPGQEEPNAEFVETMGFGYVAKTPKRLAEKAVLVLDGGDHERIERNYINYHLNDHSDRGIADFIDSII